MGSLCPNNLFLPERGMFLHTNKAHESSGQRKSNRYIKACLFTFTRCGNHMEKYRNHRCTEGLTKYAGRSQHTACTSASLDRSGGGNRYIIRCLKQSDTNPANGHPPTKFPQFGTPFE